MSHLLSLMLIAAALTAAGAAGVAAAQAGLAGDRAGLGIKPGSPVPEPLIFGSEVAAAWQAGRPSDFSLYTGAREQVRFGVSEAGSYGGVVQPLIGNLGSSLEAGYVQESLHAPRRYVLTGQLHSDLREGRALSVGLQYRMYDGDSVLRTGSPADTPFRNGYSLASAWLPAAGYSPSYQLQFSYQHSPASIFGLAFGRDVEAFTPYIESSGPRQLTFTGQHWLTPSWALSYDLLTYDLATPLRSQNLRLGLGMRYRF